MKRNPGRPRKIKNTSHRDLEEEFQEQFPKEIFVAEYYRSDYHMVAQQTEDAIITAIDLSRDPVKMAGFLWSIR